MITKEEFNNVKIGDCIQIVDQWNDFTHENPNGKMDYLLGRTFEVTQKATETTVKKRSGINDFLIHCSDGCTWSLNLHCIEKVIRYSTKSIDDKSLERMLMEV